MGLKKTKWLARLVPLGGSEGQVVTYGESAVPVWADPEGGGGSWDGDIADVNLDSGTDIGADLADADLILVDDGAGGTNRKCAMSRVKTYVAPPMIILTKSSSVNQDVGGANGTEVYWTWDGEDKKDSIFTHDNETNPSRITVSETGWYSVRFVGNVQQTGANRTTLQGIYRIDGGTTTRKGTIRDYARGSGYGNLSPGLDCVIQITASSYIEVGTRVEDTDATYTLNACDGTEVTDEENMLVITKVA